MDRFNHQLSSTAKADSPRPGSGIGRLLFFGGLVVTASAVLIGFLIEEELQASGMHRMTGPDANPNPGLALLFGFGFPAGLFLAALGGILQGPSTPRTASRLAQELRAIVANMDEEQPPAYRARVEDNKRVSYRMVAAVVARMSDRQVVHLGQQIRGYRSDLANIECE